MPTPEATLDRAIKLAQSLSGSNPQPLSEDATQLFNQAVTDQVEAVTKPYRARPISGGWSIANGLWLTREAQYADRADGSAGREGDPIVGFTHKITNSDPASLLVIEQQVRQDGIARLSLVEVGNTAGIARFIPATGTQS